MEGGNGMNSATDVWDKTLEILRNDLTETAIKMWLNECYAVKLSNSSLLLHTPSKFKKETIETRFIGSIRSALCEIFSGEFDVVLISDEELNAMETSDNETSDDYLSIDEYTFEQFVVGNSNKFAHAAALAVGEGKQKANYNPLLIYGESGLGKTHLLYAIRNAVEKNFKNHRIVYVTGEAFTNEIVAAIQQGKNVEFREKYRTADIFLVDDVQFIAGKKAAQEEFFNTFNTLYELGRQIVFTSDRPPSEITLLADRLMSRLQASLIVDIQPPDDALRVAIIRNKAKQLGVVLPDDVTNYIASNITSNVRQLEGAVKMIIAYRDIMDDDITVATVNERIKEMFKGPRELIPTIDTIIEETGNYYSLTPEELKSQSRTRDTVLARHISMYLIRKLTNFSLKDVGSVFGGRDHSTVISSIRRIEAKISKSQDFSGIIRDITSNINSKTKFYNTGHSTYQHI